MYDQYDALIFDMDGTLVDSGQLHQQAWLTMLEKYKFPVDRQHMRSLAGMSTKKTIELLIEKYALDIAASVEEMATFKEHFVNENFQNFVKPTALIDIVKKYHGKKPMAIGTGADSREAQLIVKICGISEYIDIIVCADQVKHPKPAPDTFLRCAELLNVKPENCVVFEDSQFGLQAARSAHMAAIDVLAVHQIENDYFL